MSVIDFIVDLAELHGYGDSEEEKSAWRRCPHWERVEILRSLFKIGLVRRLCKREEIFSHCLGVREELDKVLVRIAAGRLHGLPPILIPLVYLAHDGSKLSIEYLKDEGDEVFEFLEEDSEGYLASQIEEWKKTLLGFEDTIWI